MPNCTVLNEAPIGMSELKAELAHIKERDGELNFRGQKTAEYLSYFIEYDSKVIAKLGETITKLEIPRLKPEHLVKLLDLLPRSADEVKMVLQGYNLTITKENLGKIAEAITELLNKEMLLETAQPPKSAPEAITKIEPKVEETPAEPVPDAAEAAAEADEKAE